LQNGIDGVNGIRVPVQDKENIVGVGRAVKTRFKNFSIKLHDLAYSPVLKHKIGVKQKLLHQRNNRGIKKRLRRKSTGTSNKKKASSTIENVQTGFAEPSEKQQQSTGLLEESTGLLEESTGLLEECWKSRTSFIGVFDIDQYPDSREAASVLLKWLIYPVESDKFLRYWLCFAR